MLHGCYHMFANPLGRFLLPFHGSLDTDAMMLARTPSALPFRVRKVHQMLKPRSRLASDPEQTMPERAHAERFMARHPGYSQSRMIPFSFRPFSLNQGAAMTISFTLGWYFAIRRILVLLRASNHPLTSW